MSLPTVFTPFGRMSTNPNDRPPASWRITYGPWRPLDERRFQEAIERATGRTADTIFGLWAQGASSLGPLGQGLVEAMRMAGMGQDAGVRIERQLFTNRVPNPTTSRPASGQPDSPDDLPGWVDQLPYYFAPALLPKFQVSKAASMAALATLPTAAQVKAFGDEVRRVYGSSDYANRVLATLAALPTSRVVATGPNVSALLQARSVAVAQGMASSAAGGNGSGAVAGASSTTSRVAVGVGLALAVAAIVAAASR